MSRSTAFSRRYFAKIALFTIIAATAAVIIFSYEKADELSKRRELYRQIAEVYAEEYSLDISLVMAVMECESGFDPGAVSPAGACGLLQLMPDTFEWMAKGEELDIFSPEDNTRIGCKYLAYLFKRFEDEPTVLAAYNAGEGNVRRWLSDEYLSEDGKTLQAIPFPETSEYVARVLRAKEKYLNSKLFK